MHRSPLLLSCCLTLLSISAWGKPLNPKQMTMELFRHVSQIIKIDDNRQKRQEGLKLIANYFDFNTFAKWTLHDHWKTLSQTQRQKFLSLFRDRFYETILNRLSRQARQEFFLKIASERPTKEFTEVKCELQYDTKKGKFSLIWIRHFRGWRLVDIDVSNASLVANYQGQFNKIIRDQGFDEVLKRLLSDFQQ